MTRYYSLDRISFSLSLSFSLRGSPLNRSVEKWRRLENSSATLMRGEKSGTGVTGSQMRVPRPSTRLANRERTLETGATIRGNRWITVDLASYRSPHSLSLCSRRSTTGGYAFTILLVYNEWFDKTQLELGVKKRWCRAN